MSVGSSPNTTPGIKSDGWSAGLIITARMAPQNARVAWERDGMASVLFSSPPPPPHAFHTVMHVIVFFALHCV